MAKDRPPNRLDEAWNSPSNGKTAENGNQEKRAEAPRRQDFADPVPASQLQSAAPAHWLWQGYLSQGGITLLTALWKSGKTTLLAHLLKGLETGGEFCGRKLLPGRVLFVTEETAALWAQRRDDLSLTDNVHFLIRPFRAKPDTRRWNQFLAFLGECCLERPVELLVFDTISALWPVRDENDACEVQEAMMPLWTLLPPQTALLLNHHNRKGDGAEATSSRGSGALPAFVDTILEMRRFDPATARDRRRVLSGYGRWDDTPAEVVVELGEDGYSVQGDRQETATRDLRFTIDQILPDTPPGMTLAEVLEAWPDDPLPRRQRLQGLLAGGVKENRWKVSGSGVRGDPLRWWNPPP